MNNIHDKALAHYRTDAEIDVHDLAYIFNIDHGQLTKIERGLTPAPLEAVILYLSLIHI